MRWTPCFKPRKKLGGNWNALYALKFQEEKLTFSLVCNITWCVPNAMIVTWSLVQCAGKTSEWLGQQETLWQKKWLSNSPKVDNYLLKKYIKSNPCNFDWITSEEQRSLFGGSKGGSCRQVWLYFSLMEFCQCKIKHDKTQFFLFIWNYSRRRLIGSLWATEEVIPITEWSNYPNSLFQWMILKGFENGTW